MHVFRNTTHLFAKAVGIPAIAAGWGRATDAEPVAEAPPMLAPQPAGVLHLLDGDRRRAVAGQ